MDLPSRPDSGAAPPEAEGEVRLAREITFVDATMMGVGALMGGGVFVLLGLATAEAGPAVLLSLFLNGFITIPTLLVYAELGSASDDAGGGYLWVKQGLGQPFGFLGGWLSWFSHVIACALYSIASAAFIMVLLGFAGWLPEGGITELRPLALSLAALFIFLNFVGVKIGIKTENVINTLVLVAVLVFIGAGLWKVSQDQDLVRSNFSPFWPSGSGVQNLSSVFLAMGITFIAFEGYEIISQTSEEIQDPKRNIPKAIWASFLIAWGVMLLVTFIAIGATRNPTPGLQSWLYLGGLKERALIEAAQQVLPYGAVLVAGCALLLQLTALNATIYSSSRVSFAMGRDGQLPRFFGRVHRKRRTPHTAVLGSGVLVLAMALLPIEHVAVSADVMFLMLFLLVNLSYIKLRKVIPQEKFGFKAPLFPYIPVIGIFTKFFLAIYLWKYSHVAWYVTGAWIAVGLTFYYLWVRRREAAVPVPIVPLAAPLPMAAGRQRKAFRVVVLLSSPAPSTARALARTAATVAEALDGEVVLLQPVVVPELTPLAEGQRFYKDRSLLAQARAAVAPAVPASTVVRIGHSLDALVRETVREEGASLLLMSGQARATVGQPTSPLLAYPPCDVAVLRLKKPDVTADNVLVTTYSGPHATLGIRLGTALTKAAQGKLLLYHATAPGENAEAAEARGKALLAQNAVPGVATELRTEPGPAIRKVLDQSRGHDLVVVGASATPKWWRKGVLGPRTQEITDRVAGNVLIVRSGQGMGGPGGNWLGRRLMQARRYFQTE